MSALVARKKSKLPATAFVFSLCLIGLIIMTSCSINNTVNQKNEGENKMVLNERQMSICEDLGLATDYEELTNDQRKSIVRIEELLEYLDKKYDTTFNYLGYNEPFLQAETLKAYTDEFSEYEYTTLTVKDDGSFVDDYPFQFVKRIIRTDFTDYLRQNTGLNYKVYVVGGATDIIDIAKVDRSSLSGTTKASCTVFVEENIKLKKDEISNAISEWYKSLGIYGNTNVVVVNHSAFDKINYDNFNSIKREESVENLLICEVSSSGSTTVY